MKELNIRLWNVLFLTPVTQKNGEPKTMEKLSNNK